MNTEQPTDQDFMVVTEAEMRDWRMRLQIGDDIALRNTETNGGISYSLDTVHEHTDYDGDDREFTNAEFVCTSLEAFSRETGHYPDGDSRTCIVYPTDSIREQIQLSTALQEDWDFRGESLEKVRAIAWILDILHGPAPGFDAPDFNRGERADTLEALMVAVKPEHTNVYGFSGSIRTQRQAAANVVRKDGGEMCFGVGLRSVFDVSTGNGPGSEELAHLIAFAVRSVPDYLRLLREEQRTNERIDRLTAAVLRLRGHADIIEPNAGIDKPHTSDTITWDSDGDAVYAPVDDEGSDRLSDLWGRADNTIACLVEHLGGRVVLTDAETEGFLPGRSMTTEWYDDRIVIEVKGGK